MNATEIQNWKADLIRKACTIEIREFEYSKFFKDTIYEDNVGRAIHYNKFYFLDHFGLKESIALYEKLAYIKHELAIRLAILKSEYYYLPKEGQEKDAEDMLEFCKKTLPKLLNQIKKIIAEIVVNGSMYDSESETRRDFRKVYEKYPQQFEEIFCRSIYGSSGEYQHFSAVVRFNPYYANKLYDLIISEGKKYAEVMKNFCKTEGGVE